MLYHKQFVDYVINPTLLELGLYSESASQLLLLTAIQESGLSYLHQLGEGPALGLFQIEPKTYYDVYENYLSYRRKLYTSVNRIACCNDKALSNGEVPNVSNLITNMAFATAIARIIYYRAPKKLPEYGDITGMAKYWKEFYNTKLGKGTIEQFVMNTMDYVD